MEGDPISRNSKELTPGIILHKNLYKSSDPQYVNVYQYQIEYAQFNILNFTCDFTGSGGLVVLNEEVATPEAPLCCVVSIPPKGKKDIAILGLSQSWNMKTKFMFKTSPAPLDLQEEYIAPVKQRISQEIDTATDQIGNLPIEIMTIDQILSKLKELDIKYVDLDFPPSDNCVYNTETTEEFPFQNVIHWRRASEFMKPDPRQGLEEIAVFAGKDIKTAIEPNDIKQGSLGDCWFMCALASLAERPVLVDRLFITKEVNEFGIYRLKICKNGEWIEVTVDDYFPCFPDGGPMFSRAHGNELWVLLLEKAYAKVHGNYYTLRGGFANEGMIDLTGCPSYNIDFENGIGKELIDIKELFNKMKGYDNNGYMISASTPGEDRWTETGGPNQSGGLVAGHAYSVIAVKEYQSHQLVNMRNPWGQFEWDGAWGDSDKENWTPEIIQALNVVIDDKDGTFWMCFEDFIKHFRSINVCRVSSWNEVRVKGKFVKTQGYMDPNEERCISRWYYNLKTESRERAFIGVHQEDERVEGALQTRPYLDIGIAIMKKNENGCYELYKNATLVRDRQCEVEVDFLPGEYVILPRTTGASLRRPSEKVKEKQNLMLESGKLTQNFTSCLIDLFRKFDMELGRTMDYDEFKNLMDFVGREITQEQFKLDILKKYCSTEEGFTERGFIHYFKDCLIQFGESEIRGWLQKLGYEQDLYSSHSRSFLITFHADHPINISVSDAINSDLEERASLLIINQTVKDKGFQRGFITNDDYSLVYHYNDVVYSYTYAIINRKLNPIHVLLDCSGSQNMVFSVKNGKSSKVVQPGEMVLLMHLTADPDADSFRKSSKVTVKDF